MSATDTSTENNTGNAGNDGSEDNDGGKDNDKGDVRENGNVHGEQVNDDNDAEGDRSVGAEKVGSDNSQHEENDGGEGDDVDTEEDLLELEANPDEFEDLAVANSSQDNEASVEQEEEEEEDIEVLEHVVNLKDSDGPPGEHKVQSVETNIKKLTPEVVMEEPGNEKSEDPVCPPGEEPVLPTPVKVHQGPKRP